MGLKRLTSKSITHMDLHKLNNKLVSAQLEHFGAWTNHEQTQTHNTHHNPDLGESTTFPLIVYSMPSHGTSTQMSFCLEILKWESRNSQSWDSHDFGGHNFVCKPSIKMRFKAKLQPSSRAFQWYVVCHLHAKEIGVI